MVYLPISTLLCTAKNKTNKENQEAKRPLRARLPGKLFLLEQMATMDISSTKTKMNELAKKLKIDKRKRKDNTDDRQRLVKRQRQLPPQDNGDNGNDTNGNTISLELPCN